MIPKNLFIFFVALYTLLSCSERKNFKLNGYDLRTYPVQFNTSQSVFTDHKITCKLQLRAEKNGDTLLFTTLIENNSKDTIRINIGDLKIVTSTDIRSGIAWCDIKKLTIHPYSVDTLKFRFSPINNLTLYNRIDYKGDLDSIYYIKINFIKIDNPNATEIFGEKVRFTMDSSSYRIYKHNFLREKNIQLFHIQNKNELRNKLLIYNQHIFSSHKKGDLNDLVLSGTDVLINGIVMNIHVYFKDSILYLKLKILNQSEQVLMVDVDQLIISTDGNLIYPHMLSVHNSFPEKNKNSFPIIKGSRFETEVKYSIGEINHIILLMNGFKYFGINKSVLPEPFHFVKDNFLDVP